MCENLSTLLIECNTLSTCIHALMRQEVRIPKYKYLKDFNACILVLTNLYGHGIDIEQVNVVINYDISHDSDQFFHCVGCAGKVWS